MFSIFSVKFSMLDNAEICYGTDVVKKAQNIYQGFFSQIIFDQSSRIPHIMSSFMGEEEGLAKIITLLLTPPPVIKF